jgi:hypothetical protein
MNIDWLDILKIAAPLFTAIVMVWVKGWIESCVSRINKQHALSRLLHDEFQDLTATVQALKRIATSATQSKLRLVSVDVSSLISKFSCDLADLDPKRSYCYADLASKLELVNKGLQRLSNFTLNRAGASSKDVLLQLDSAIIGQAKITAGDYITMSKAALEVIKIIPERLRVNSDPQVMKNIEDSLLAAENEREEWPSRAISNDDQPAATA